MAWPTKMRGDKDPVVRSLQYLLREHGADIVPDGNFGPETEEAVVAFQKSEGLKANGVAVDEVWQRLAIELKFGAQGEAVKAFQTQLYLRGTLPSIDGIYSMKTDISVRRYQAMKHLQTNGMVDTATWETLLGETTLPEISKQMSEEGFDWQAKLRSMLRPGE